MSAQSVPRDLAPTLRSRLFLLVAAVALPLILLDAGAIYAAYRSERGRAEAGLKEQARALALLEDRELGRVEAVLQTLAASSALVDNDIDRFDREIRAAAVPLHGYPIALIAPDGRQLLSSAWPPGKRLADKFAPVQLNSVLQTGRPAITDLYAGANSSQPTIAIGIPVFAGSTAVRPKPDFMLAAGIPASRLAVLLNHEHLPQGWVAGVIDRSFRVVARTEQQERFVGTLAIPSQMAAMQAGKDGVVHATRADGVPASTMFARAPESGFTVALSVPDEAFQAPLRAALWRTMLIAMAISAAGLALALSMARGLAAGIGSLVMEGEPAAAGAKGAGRRSAPRLHEVELVAARLARIAAERDRAEAALRDLASRLEQQVIERTEALAESEARLRGIFDAQFQYVTLLTPDGRRVEMNRSALDFGGATRENVLGELYWDASWWREEPQLRGRIRDAVARAAGGETVRMEFSVRSAEDQPTVLDLSFRPLRDKNSNVVNLLIAEAHDITELRALEARVAQTSRLEALGQLAGGVAHDFNNVLQSVSGAMALLTRRAENPAAVRRLAEMVDEAIERGAAITRRLVSFARRDALIAAPVEVAGLLDNLRELLSHTLAASITVQVEVPDDLPPTLADRAQLETVLVNLATNARDAMAQGGVLRFTASAETVPGPGTSAGPPLAPGRYIRLSASDNGVGMDAATLARAMEPFFTTKRPGEGTGLGLSMARDFAERSGGLLVMTSTPGAGTTATLWLPQALAAAAASTVHRAERSGRSQLLLAEDDMMLRQVLAAALEAHGYQVRQADNAATALAALESTEAPDRIELLITDLSMPGMSGLQLIQAARRRRPGLPAILLTGYAGEAPTPALREENESGDFILLHKPVSELQLVSRVEALLESSRGKASESKQALLF